MFSDKEILKNFLEVVLEKEVTDIEVTNQFSLNKIRYEKKVGILDIKANINKSEIVDLEMQRNAKSNYQKRIILYASNLVTNQLNRGHDYADLKDVTVINILDHVMFPDIENIHTVWSFREKNNPEYVLFDGFEIHYIELPKFRKSNPDFENKLNQWLALIDTENKEWLEEAMENNSNIKDAKDKVDEFMTDDETKILIELREKWQRDYNASMDYAKQEGKIEIVKKMLARNMDIKDICEITGLSESEIKALK